MIITGIHSKGGREKTIRSVLFIYIWSPYGIFKWISSKGCWLYEGIHTHTHTHTHTSSVQKKVMGKNTNKEVTSIQMKAKGMD